MLRIFKASLNIIKYQLSTDMLVGKMKNENFAGKCVLNGVLSGLVVPMLTEPVIRNFNGKIGK